MSKTLTLTVLKDVYVTLSTVAGPQRVRLTDIESLPSGMRFRVEATIPLGGFCYVVQIGANDQVHVDDPSSGVRSVLAGDRLTIPDSSHWLTAAIDGPVRVVIADQPVPAGEWPPIDPGRDGDAHTPTGTEGRMAQTAGQIGQQQPPPAPTPPAPPSMPPAKQPSPRK